MKAPTNVLVTGGAGFIGSNFIHYLLGQSNFSGRVINLDKLTYAGNLLNLRDVEADHGRTRYVFQQGDIAEAKTVEQIFRDYQIDTVVHFAAESHVDRSVLSPREFIYSNVVGTFNLLETARKQWAETEQVLFHQVSTDEVYGSLGDSGLSCEASPYNPRSPYSASKAGADHLVRAYYHTYGLPVTITNCSNNYGPYQFPEKFIPLMINNMRLRRPLPVYGDGANVRDWLYVMDHADALWCVIRHGKPGSTYNVGGESEWRNIDLLHLLCERMAAASGESPEHYRSLITFVKDRPGHDRRYALDCGKIRNELGWTPQVSFQRGLDMTIRWYLDNPDWLEAVACGSYRDWYTKNYVER